MDKIELYWINIIIKSNNRIFYCPNYILCVLYLQQCKQSFFITSMKIEFNLKLMYLHNIYNDIIVYLILIIEIRLKIIKNLGIGNCL